MQSADPVRAVTMKAVLMRHEVEVEGQSDVSYHSFAEVGRVGGPTRGTGGSRHRICLGDVGAGLSAAFCRSLADNRRL